MDKASAFSRLRFRCQSISEPDQFHLIDISNDGKIICSCTGEPGRFCSHVDATLVHGERAMVPHEDRHIADCAQQFMKGRLRPHKNWKSHWLTKRKWRGLPPKLSKAAQYSSDSGLPLLSIEGRGKIRKETEAIVLQKGWVISPRPVRGCVFHLIPDENLEPGQAAHEAQSRGIPVITYLEWAELADSITDALIQRLAVWQEADDHPKIMAA